MSLPYENATSGDKAIGDMQKILRSFGCQKFGYMIDDGEGSLLVQFEYRGRQVSVKASMSGYASAWLKEHPYSTRMKKTAKQHEAEAMQVASIAVFSILRDWIKGQVMAIETGILSFEGAFLGQLMLPSGKTVLETVTSNKLLPNPEGGE